MDFLESMGKKANPQLKDDKGRTLLHILANKNMDGNIQRALEIFRILVKEYKLEVLALDKKKRNILHYAGSSRAKFEAIYDELLPA